MKTRTKKASLPNLTKLSNSRTSNRTSLLGSSSNASNSLFGPRKNMLVTYSKSRPLHFVKKKHFLSPDTPQVSTPDSLQTTGKEEELTKVDDKSKTFTSQGGSYTTGKTPLSLEGSHFNPPSTVGSTVRPTLALRNISNIPIDKTLSRTQCTPRRLDTEATHQTRNIKPSNAKRKLTPFSGKMKNRLCNYNRREHHAITPLQLNEDEEETRSPCSTIKRQSGVVKIKSKGNDEEGQEIQNHSLESGSPSKRQKTHTTSSSKHQKPPTSMSKETKPFPSTTSSSKHNRLPTSMNKETKPSHNTTNSSNQLRHHNTKSSITHESTNYSLKSMSTDSHFNTKTISGQVHTLTAQSMLLCTIIEGNDGSKEVVGDSSQHRNSTFNEDIGKINVEDYFAEELSPIKEDIDTENCEKSNADGSQSVTLCGQDPNTKKNPSNEAPKTSTPVDQGKNTGPHMDEGCEQEYTMKNPSNEAPKTSTPVDQGKNTGPHMDEGCEQEYTMKNPSNEAPKTSTPVDQGKNTGPHIDEPGISPITKDNGIPELLPKPEEIKVPGVSPIPKDNEMPQSIPNTEEYKEVQQTKKKSSKDRDKSITKDKIIEQNNKNIKENSKTTSLPLQASMCIEDDSDDDNEPDNITPEILPNIKTSLPLQASMCIEDDSDDDNITPEILPNIKTSLPLQASMCIEDDSDDDNITPEIIPNIKSQCSSSKRKLQYIDMPFKPNTDHCFLLDFPCTVNKKPCKIWMKKTDKHQRESFALIKNHTFPMDILSKAYH